MTRGILYLYTIDIYGARKLILVAYFKLIFFLNNCSSKISNLQLYTYNRVAASFSDLNKIKHYIIKKEASRMPLLNLIYLFGYYDIPRSDITKSSGSFTPLCCYLTNGNSHRFIYCKIQTIGVLST